MKKKAVVLSLAFLFSAVSLAGCAQGSKYGKDAASPTVTATTNEPVTLTVYYHNVTLSDAEFQKFFVEPTRKKYPNISLELLKPTQGAYLEDLIGAGQTPDLIFASNGYFNLFKKYDLMQDLSGFIKKYKVDLSLYNKPAMEVVKQAGENGEIYSIPYSLNYGALFYNKDIFDKFGISYPGSLMSWEELLPLASKLNRTVDGIQYVGLEAGNADTMGGALGLPHVGANDQPNVDKPEYKRIFEYLKKVYEIPGQIGPGNRTQWNRNSFIKDQNLAMTQDWTNDIASPLEEGFKAGFTNWDVSGLPNFQDKLGTGRPVDAHLTVISKSSKHKEQAFQVLMQTVSKETQMEVSAGGLISAMDDTAIQDNFGKNLKSFQGKHIENIFKTKMAVIPPSSRYGTKVSSIIRDEQKNMALGLKDVNTALKDAMDRGVQNISEEKAK